MKSPTFRKRYWCEMSGVSDVASDRPNQCAVVLLEITTKFLRSVHRNKNIAMLHEARGCMPTDLREDAFRFFTDIVDLSNENHEKAFALRFDVIIERMKMLEILSMQALRFID